VGPADGAAPALPELRAFVAARLAPHKAPRLLVLVPELPRGPTGKPTGLDALPWEAGTGKG
jgi:acyl-coenzyme A synthetase/AMP-(fatty) acid ligase